MKLSEALAPVLEHLSNGGAIKATDDVKVKEMSDERGIYVLIDRRNGQLNSVSRPSLGGMLEIMENYAGMDVWEIEENEAESPAHVDQAHTH